MGNLCVYFHNLRLWLAWTTDSQSWRCCSSHRWSGTCPHSQHTVESDKHLAISSNPTIVTEMTHGKFPSRSNNVVVAAAFACNFGYQSTTATSPTSSALVSVTKLCNLCIKLQFLRPST